MSLCTTDVSRRALLGATGALFASSFIPRIASAAGTRDPRLICIVLRGALDGLSTVAPVGDPAYAGLREDIALSIDGGRPAIPLDGFFALHPAMTNFARLFKARQALVVHAAATGYRDRSHFDGQDVLESGQPVPGHLASGWLNRLLGTLPRNDRVVAKGALGVGTVAPLIVRGPAPVIGWAPRTLPRASDDLKIRLADLYGQRDPVLAQALARGAQVDRMMDRPSAEEAAAGLRGPAVAMRRVAEGSARLIAADSGPRIAALAFDGWDTHAFEGGATGRLADLLLGLDVALATFETGLGERWKDTVVMVITEFGRTARVNGSVGTDHGTATVALLAGGAVRGGRVVADWPGLAPAQLYEQRDLRPTVDVRAIAKGVIGGLFDVSERQLGTAVFPRTEGLPALSGLVV